MSPPTCHSFQSAGCGTNYEYYLSYYLVGFLLIGLRACKVPGIARRRLADLLLEGGGDNVCDNTCIHAYIPRYLHTYIYACMHTCMHTYRHTYIYTSVHPCKHTIQCIALRSIALRCMALRPCVHTFVFVVGCGFPKWLGLRLGELGLGLATASSQKV